MVESTQQKAADFVRREGSRSQQMRLEYLTGGTSQAADAAELLAARRPDGGFAPPWAPDYSSVDATCYRLAQAEEAGLGPGRPELSDVVAFLVRRQRADGSWEEDLAQAALAPRWAKPGDPMALAYLTANAGLWTMRGGAQEAAGRAARFLKGSVDASGTLPSFLHANWLAAALFWGAGDRETSERLMAYLLRRIADISASGLSWMIASLLGVGVGPGHPLIAEARKRLVLHQRDDGAFPSEDGPAHDVDSTLAALHALALASRRPGGPPSAP